MLNFKEFQAMHKVATMRPRFSHVYSIPKADRKKATDKLRLLEVMTFVAPGTSPDFLAIPEEGEFAVVDIVRGEKGFFIIPEEFSPQEVHTMVEEFFGSRATRIQAFLWIA